MMIKSILAVFVSVSVFLLLSCTQDPNEAANKLFVEANQLILDAENVIDKDYEIAFENYSEAFVNIDKISKQYAASDLAVQITQGGVSLANMPLSEARWRYGVLSRIKSEKGSPELVLINHAKRLLLLAHDIEDDELSDAKKYIKYAEIILSKDSDRLSRHINDAANQDEKDEIMGFLANYYSMNKEYIKAINYAEEIEDDSSKAFILSDIATEYAVVGKKDKAIELLSKVSAILEKIEDKDIILNRMVKGYVSSGDIDSAIRLESIIESDFVKQWAIVDICVALVNGNEVSRAVGIANEIEDFKIRLEVLAKISKELAEKGDRENASEMISEILLEADNAKRYKKGRVNYHNYDIYRAVAAALVINGDVEQALEIANDYTDKSLNNMVLNSIGKALVSSGNVDYALRVAGRISDEDWKSFTLRDVARALMESGQLDQTLHVLESINSPSIKIPLLIEMSVQFHSKFGSKNIPNWWLISQLRDEP